MKMSAKVARTSWNGRFFTHWVDCRVCGDGQPAAGTTRVVSKTSGPMGATTTRRYEVFEPYCPTAFDGARDIKTRKRVAVYACSTCGEIGRGRDIQVPGYRTS